MRGRGSEIRPGWFGLSPILQSGLVPALLLGPALSSHLARLAGADRECHIPGYRETVPRPPWRAVAWFGAVSPCVWYKTGFITGAVAPIADPASSLALDPADEVQGRGWPPGWRRAVPVAIPFPPPGVGRVWPAFLLPAPAAGCGPLGKPARVDVFPVWRPGRFPCPVLSHTQVHTRGRRKKFFYFLKFASQIVKK